MVTIAVAFMALLIPSQVPKEPAKDLFMHSATAPGVEVGSYALSLWPNLDGKGRAVEMRRVDMRDVFPVLNAMGPAPSGETIYKGPARFERASPRADRLDVAVTEGQGTVVLTLTYGDRRLALALTR